MLMKNSKHDHLITLHAVRSPIRVGSDDELPAIGAWRRFTSVGEALQHLQTAENMEDGSLPQLSAN